MKKCSVEGCNNKHSGHGYCDKHLKQMKRYGYVKKRTVLDPNEIVKYDDHAEIILYNKDCEEVDRALIDLEYIDMVKDIKWYKGSNGYVQNKKLGLLHRYLLSASDNQIIDHIDRNKLNNRINNLRCCNKAENQMNRSLHKNSTSGLRGIRKTPSNKYRVDIGVNNKKIYIGIFESLQDTIAARQQAEIDYFGEFAPHLNDKE